MTDDPAARARPPAVERAWTSRKLLAWTTQAFERAGLDSPRRSAEMLLGHVIELDRLKLYLDPDRPASDLERSAFRDLVERALAHEPVDYLVGYAPFFSMTLKVGPGVLVPRPSTEALVEHVLQHQRRTSGFALPTAADVGTGSGTIAVALAKQWKQRGLAPRIVATDVSEAALDIARQNAQDHGVADAIDFRQGDLLEPLAGERFGYLVSNPPYIPDAEWPDVPPNVKDHEPELALRGGADGLRCVRPILEGAPALLDRPGAIAIEIATATATPAQAIAEKAGFAHLAVLPDHERLPRVLVATLE
ncbi:MAG: peptide chain release factor N(5)-glutamine methyltransferase [Planctomycetota bacterium]